MAGDKLLAEGGLDAGRERGSSGKMRENSVLCILFNTVGIGGLDGRVGRPMLEELSGRLELPVSASKAAPFKGSLFWMSVPGAYSGMSNDD